jgi:hypothetical protein
MGRRPVSLTNHNKAALALLRWLLRVLDVHPKGTWCNAAILARTPLKRAGITSIG